MTEPRRLSHATTNQRVFELVAGRDLPARRVLDVGAGEGYFSRLLGEHLKARHAVPPASVVRACDLYPDRFRYPDVPCDAIAPDGRLPYPDGGFDVACAIEVIEHLEDQFAFARELYRVLRPGGRAIVTTPNVLNLNSRLRFLHSGLAVLFDPLPLASHDPVHTAGHIHPIAFYYLGYLFQRAGFRELRVHYDRTKKSAVGWLVLLAPFIFPARALAALRLRLRQPAVYAENRRLFGTVNSLRMLTSRSVVLEAVK